ncbi:hypothetical protein DO65_4195 [Burkholderia pseudomallei]|nr:hypothetical protein DO65_4195 [Burkholderia pseudomallei]
MGCAMVQRQSMRSAIGDGAPSMLHRQPSISATNPVWVGSKLANTAAPVVMRRDAAGGEYLTIAPPALARAVRVVDRDTLSRIVAFSTGRPLACQPRAAPAS